MSREVSMNIPWYEQPTEPQYIEIPLVKYVGGSDKILWPYFAIALPTGSFILAFFLW
jgi:hypothetical protein